MLNSVLGNELVQKSRELGIVHDVVFKSRQKGRGDCRIMAGSSRLRERTLQVGALSFSAAVSTGETQAMAVTSGASSRAWATRERKGRSSTGREGDKKVTSNLSWGRSANMGVKAFG